MNSIIRLDEIIDIHVHLGGPPHENDALYYWSDKFTKSLTFESIKVVTRMTKSNATGPRFIGVLLEQLKESKYVNKIVLLGLDQAYQEDGTPLPKNSHLYVSNEYLIHLTQMYPKFLFGCSVHPYSPDALERLWYCAKSGAVLCKWLPSSQAIDPTHPLSVKFYQALAALELPLLLHVGPENAIPAAGISKADELLFNAAAGHYSREYGDAVRLALNAGARVIIAHCATPIGSLIDKNNAYWEKVFDAFLKRVRVVPQNTELYGDISAFCIPGRYKYIRKIMPVIKELPEHFCYGSDYPIPIISFDNGSTLEHLLETFGWLASRALPKNDFDKNYSLLKDHFPPQVLTNAANILRNPQKPVLDMNHYLASVGAKPAKVRKGFWDSVRGIF